MKFIGEGETEKMIEKLVYSQSGDTLTIEKPMEKFKMERSYEWNGLLRRQEN